MAPGEWDWLIALILDPIRQSVLSDVIKWVTSPLDRLLDPLRNVGDTIRTLYQVAAGIPNTIIAGLLAPLGTVAHQIATSPDRIVGPLMSPLATIAHRIASNPDRIVGPLMSSLGTVAHYIASNPDRIVGPLMSPLATIGHHIASNPDRLAPYLAAPLSDIRAALLHLSSAGVGSLTMPAAQAAANIGAGTVALNTLPANLGTVGMSLLLADQQTRQGLADQYWRQLTELGQAVQGRIADTAGRGVPGFLQGLQRNITDTLASGYDLISGYVLGSGPIRPNDAPTVGMRAFLAASGLGAAAHAVSTAVELVHPLKTMGVHYLSGFLADMGSFSSIGNALMGTLASVGVATPMRWYLNARARSNLPTMGDLQAMHRKHTLSRAEFAKYAAHWGLDDMWIERFIEYLPADPRLFDILRMAETGIPETSPPSEIIPRLQRMGIRAGGNPDWWLELKFALAGYDWVDIPKLVDTVHARMTSSERNRLVTTASTNFRQGYMTEAQFRAELADAGKNQAQINWKVRAERLAALRDDIDDLVKLFTDQYLKDVISHDEMRIALVNIGVTPTKTDILARRAAIRKRPKPVDDTDKRAEKATREMQTAFSRMYKEQYRADMITADGYRAALRAIGIAEDVAWATVELEIARRIGQTTKTDLRQEAQAATRTQAARQRLFRERYRAGLIDATQYYVELVDAGVLPDEARAIVDTEAILLQTRQADAAASLARAETTRTRAALERLYRDQYRAYMIDEIQYRAYLGNIELPPARIGAIVQAEVLRREQELADVEAREAQATAQAAQRAHATLLQAQYDAGMLDADQYLAGLLQVGVDRELAQATVELAEVKRFALLERQALKDAERLELDVQRKQSALYVRRYRAAELTARDLYHNLVDIGIPDILAAATVELEELDRQADADTVREQLVIPAIKRAWTLYVKDAEARYDAGELTLDGYVSELIFSGMADDVAQLIALSTQHIRKS